MGLYSGKIRCGSILQVVSLWNYIAGSLLRQWEEYKSVRRHVKRLIRLEKKRLRKATIERIREQGETSC